MDLAGRELSPDLLRHDLELFEIDAAVVVGVALVEELEEMVDEIGLDGRCIADGVDGPERCSLDAQAKRDVNQRSISAT